MQKDLSKKAVDMLLNGATLLSEPCPYCKGVRVMKKGTALCVNCGRIPKKDQKIKSTKTDDKSSSNSLEILEKKLNALSKELEGESDHEKQQEIIKSINSLVQSIVTRKDQQ